MDQLEDENYQLKGIIKFKDEEIVKLRQGVIEGPLRRYNLYMNPIVGDDMFGTQFMFGTKFMFGTNRQFFLRFVEAWCAFNTCINPKPETN